MNLLQNSITLEFLLLRWDDTPEGTIYADEDIREALRGWHTVCHEIRSNSISWCLALLEHEVGSANRPFIISRLKSRIANLCAKKVKECLQNAITAARAKTDS